MRLADIDQIKRSPRLQRKSCGNRRLTIVIAVPIITPGVPMRMQDLRSLEHYSARSWTFVTTLAATSAELQKAGKDGIFNGADDNASGCAALLLLAEAIHAQRANMPDSCRTVIFASFDADAFQELSGPAVKALDDGKFEATFRFKAPPSTKSVTLRGSFNKWDAKANPMDGPDQDGVFTARLTLPKGVYEYKFYIVETDVWLADSSNSETVGQFGNSLLTLGK